MNLATFSVPAPQNLFRAALIAAFALLAAALAGITAGASTAHAQPVLELEGGCDPDAIRPNETALVSCTVTVTNNGDETATNLVGTLFIAEGCDIPGRFTFIDRTVDGRPVPMAELELSVQIGDLAPGDTNESVTRLAWEHFAAGRAGGSLTVSSPDHPSLSAVVDLCVDINSAAAAPPSGLTVTSTLISQPLPVRPDFPPDIALPPVGDPPVFIDSPGGVSLPVEPFPEPFLPFPESEEATYEVVVANTTGAAIDGVVVTSTQTFGAVVVDAVPPATGTDAADRPIWEIGSLAANDEARILMTYGPQDAANCASVNDVIVVETAAAGDGYVAFAEPGVPVGPCQFIEPNYCLHYAPGTDFADFYEFAPCDSTICWAESPDGFGMQPVFDCDGATDYCWFLPPGEAYTPLRSCAEEVCWVQFEDVFFDIEPIPVGGPDGSGPDFGDPMPGGPVPPPTFEYYSDFPCDIDFCEFTSPDGLYSTRGECDFPVCWSQAPGSDGWQRVYDCNSLGQDTCWYSPPGDGQPVLRLCGDEVCWQTFEGNGTYYESRCDTTFCQFTSPDGALTVPGECSFPICWSSPPEGDRWDMVYDCGEFEEWCWFSPPAGSGESVLNPCAYPLDFAINPPEGAVDLEPWAQVVYGREDLCWPMPLSDGPFHTFTVPCAEIEFITWLTPPDGSAKQPVFGFDDFCGMPPPFDEILPTVEDIAVSFGGIRPPEPVSILPCPIDGQPAEGEPGTSVPAEIVAGVTSPATIERGTVVETPPVPSSAVTPAEIDTGAVTVIEPLPSSDVIPAVLLPSSRVEQIDGPIFLPVDGDDSNVPRSPGAEDSADAPSRGDDTSGPQSPNVTLLPKAGEGAGGGGDASIMDARHVILAAFATFALVTSVGVANRVRRRL